MADTQDTTTHRDYPAFTSPPRTEGEDTSDLSDQQKADQTMERLKASAKWWHDNFWDEFKDAFRSYECRAEMIQYPAGHPRAGQEDKTRTNMAMPEMFIGIRRKAVRKTRRPPTIKVHSKKPVIGELFSHMATYQWDRANEQKHQWRHVMQGDLLGISLKLHTYDDVNQQRMVRRSIDKILDQLYVKIEETDKERNYFIVPDIEERKRSDVIRADRMSEEDQAAFLFQQGPEIAMRQDFTRFSGPVSSWIFLGDWYPEPEFDTVQGSAWHIFEGIRDAEWVAYMAAKEYSDPRDGRRKPIIDPKKLEDLEEYRPLNAINEKSRATGAERDFRQVLRDVIFKSRPMYEARLVPGRRYLIHQEYTFRKGVCWIRFIGNEKIFLGEMPLPWDLGGRYPISAYVPMPSLLWGVGDSTARKGRHLWKLHNITVSQRTDLITNALKKLVPLPKGADVPSEIMDLGTLRVLFSDNYRDIIQAFQASGITIPPEAWQQEAAILRALQQLEPAMIDFGETSQAEPASQKVATLGILQQRASDAISADELEQLNNAIAEETDIKLAMWQQVLSGKELNDMTSEANDAFWSIMGAGPEHPRKQWSDPLEIQEDFEVFPEMGSTLALDDIMRKNQALELYQRAIGAPQVWNVLEAARRLASTYGVPEPEKLLAEPMPPPPPPPPRASVTLSLKGEATPEQVAQIIQEGYHTPGEPPDDTNARQTYHHLVEGAEAARAAKYLAEGESEQPEEPPV